VRQAPKACVCSTAEARFDWAGMLAGAAACPHVTVRWEVAGVLCSGKQVAMRARQVAVAHTAMHARGDGSAWQVTHAQQVAANGDEL
jgi:hypothetical protein